MCQYIAWAGADSELPNSKTAVYLFWPETTPSAGQASQSGETPSQPVTAEIKWGKHRTCLSGCGMSYPALRPVSVLEPAVQENFVDFPSPQSLFGCKNVTPKGESDENP
jgi:hypothetical protein